MPESPPLADVHDAAGASVTDFGGWSMPVEFEGIQAEHHAVRESVGVFDVSHMGQVRVTGPDAERLTNRLTTNDTAELDPGEAHYAAMTDADGVMLDDVVVYAIEGGYLVVPNAGHDRETVDRFERHREAWGLDASVVNRTRDTAMVAVQGPDARPTLAPETDIDLGDLARFDHATGTLAGAEVRVARTGYTGEDGVEVLCDVEAATAVWDAIEATPCGLGARDTLRIEMGFLLSGQDFDPDEEPRTPFEAGIGFVVKLDTEFVGRDALEGVATEGPADTFVGIELRERGVPRHGYGVETPDGEALGHVTSGTMSPTLGEPIALAYLPADYAEPGRPVRVVVRGESKKARTRTPPFIDR